MDEARLRELFDESVNGVEPPATSAEALLGSCRASRRRSVASRAAVGLAVATVAVAVAPAALRSPRPAGTGPISVASGGTSAQPSEGPPQPLPDEAARVERVKASATESLPAEFTRPTGDDTNPNPQWTYGNYLVPIREVPGFDEPQLGLYIPRPSGFHPVYEYSGAYWAGTPWGADETRAVRVGVIFDAAPDEIAYHQCDDDSPAWPARDCAHASVDGGTVQTYFQDTTWYGDKATNLTATLVGDDGVSFYVTESVRGENLPESAFPLDRDRLVEFVTALAAA